MSTSVAVDPVRCAAHGLCALVLEERITLDEWGFPIVDPAPLDGGRMHRRAQRAARACPRRALMLNTVPSAVPPSTVGA